MVRKPRNLSPEERSLWSRVTETATPLHPVQRISADPELARPNTPAAPEQFELQRDRMNSGAAKHPVMPRTLIAAPAGPVMDAKAFRKLKSGKLKPEARLDLHGMTLDRAHPALTNFILNAQAKGVRLVLVITGKGKDRDIGEPIPVRRGVLRHQVPIWLAQPPLAQAILEVAPANARHGGSGAFYVYLRRQRT